LREAGPARAVEILGLKEVPPVGAKVVTAKVAPEEKSATPQPISKPSSFKETKTPEKKLKIILKADTLGSLEAITGSFSDDVFLVHQGIGDITQSDVDLAKTTKAQIFGFNVRLTKEIEKLAQAEKVRIFNYQIIYELLEEIEKQVLKMLEPTIDEEILGKAEIIAEFEIRGTRIAGAKVREGRIAKSEKIHIKRGDQIIGDVKIVSMKHGKEDIAEAKTGQEFGVVFSPPLDFKIGDVIIAFR